MTAVILSRGKSVNRNYCAIGFFAVVRVLNVPHTRRACMYIDARSAIFSSAVVCVPQGSASCEKNHFCTSAKEFAAELNGRAPVDTTERKLTCQRINLFWRICSPPVRPSARRVK